MVAAPFLCNNQSTFKSPSALLEAGKCSLATDEVVVDAILVTTATQDDC